MLNWFSYCLLIKSIEPAIALIQINCNHWYCSLFFEHVDVCCSLLGCSFGCCLLVSWYAFHLLQYQRSGNQLARLCWNWQSGGIANWRYIMFNIVMIVNNKLFPRSCTKFHIFPSFYFIKLFSLILNEYTAMRRSAALFIHNWYSNDPCLWWELSLYVYRNADWQSCDTICVVEWVLPKAKYKSSLN